MNNIISDISLVTEDTISYQINMYKNVLEIMWGDYFPKFINKKPQYIAIFDDHGRNIMDSVMIITEFNIIIYLEYFPDTITVTLKF